MLLLLCGLSKTAMLSMSGFFFLQLQSAKRQQLDTIRSFRAGIVNVIVATSVLEEGFEICITLFLS